jgi:hypothetical protein
METLVVFLFASGQPRISDAQAKAEQLQDPRTYTPARWCFPISSTEVLNFEHPVPVELQSFTVE